VRVLNLFDAVANVDPLQFRMPATLGRDAVARAQALTERWAVELCSGAEAAASVRGTAGERGEGSCGADAAAEADAAAAAHADRPAAGGAVAASASPGQNALMASMGGGGGAGGAFTDAAGHDLAFGCDCNPWWLSSLDEAALHGDFARLA
jgi:hypothetical protein